MSTVPKRPVEVEADSDTDPQTRTDFAKSAYAKTLAEARALHAQHQSRTLALTLSHFRRHPECRQRVSVTTWEGEVKRDPNRIIRLSDRTHSRWWRPPHYWDATLPDTRRPVERRVFDRLFSGKAQQEEA